MLINFWALVASIVFALGFILSLVGAGLALLALDFFAAISFYVISVMFLAVFSLFLWLTPHTED
jgi:hypothetical protein